jgi:cytochrome c peroxidase
MRSRLREESGMLGSFRVWFGFVSCAAVAAGCANEKQHVVELGPAAVGGVTAPAAQVHPEFNPRLLRRFRPLRAVLARDGETPLAARVDLGRALYFDPRLSKSGLLSCNGCHPLERYGADGQVTSPGHEGKRGPRNSPTVYHAAGYFAQFWDGRAIDVERQAKTPILNPLEMAMKSGSQVEQVLQRISGYEPLFRNAFPNTKQAITFEHVGQALGAFERGLLTPSRWDRYLTGDKTALTAPEIDGLRIFTNVGCMVCHTGEFLGGSMFEKVGVVEPWPNQKDLGRYQVTNDERDRMVFKVPTLRNIEKTAPYFHDGSAATLSDAVRMMGRHQLGLELSDGEVVAIEVWLKTLTGPLPTDYIKPPTLPGAAG